MPAKHVQRDLPTQKHPPLIVVLAFDLDEEGELRPAMQPMEQRSELSAKAIAAALAYKHAGVIAWKRTVLPDQGEFGEPEVLFQRGIVPEME